jgi:hypothetical protein
LDTGIAGGACSDAPPSLAARGLTRHRGKLETTGSGSTSSSLPFLAGVDSHYHLQNKTKRNNKQISFCSIFRSVLGFFLFFFKSVSLLFSPLLVRSISGESG